MLPQRNKKGHNPKMTGSDNATISALYRYPVKGLGPQQLSQTTLEPGETMPFDRVWRNGKRSISPST